MLLQVIAIITLVVITAPIWIFIILFRARIFDFFFSTQQEDKKIARLCIAGIAIAFILAVIFAIYPFIFGLLLLQLLMWGLCFSALVVLGYKSIFRFFHERPTLRLAAIFCFQIYALFILWDLFIWTKSFSIFVTIGLPLLKLWGTILSFKSLLTIVPTSLFTAMAIGAITFIIILSLKPIRIIAPSIALIVFMSSLLFISDKEVLESMCAQSAKLSVDKFYRLTFLQSIRNSPFEFTIEWHAVLNTSEKIYGWSYKKMDWYEIKESKKSDARSGDLFDCKTLELVR